MENKLTFDIEPDEVKIFLEDVNECLQAMESGILYLEQNHDPETLNSIFRAAHTLKALAGTVGHHQMADLTHTLENIFDDMREGKLSPTQAVADELLVTVDVLKALRDEIVNQQASGVDVATLLARLRMLQAGDGDQDKEPAASSLAAGQVRPLGQTTQIDEGGETRPAMLEIEVVAAAEAFAPAARLYQAGLALMEIGRIVIQQPAPDSLGEEDDRLWLILATQSEPGDIEALLNEIDDMAEISVQPYIPEDAGQPDGDSAPTTPLLSDSPVIETGSFDNSPETPVLSTNSKPALSDSIHSLSKTEGAALSDSTHSLGKAEGTVRISVERLDTLMNLVGELVTSRTHLVQIEGMRHTQNGQAGVGKALSVLVPHFSHLVDQLQEEVMHARMLPIASLFNKFPRLVRDVARTAAKQVKLIIEGEATELDRAVIEAIGDPLIHLLRNAVDHGLETPAARRAAGKSPSGTIRLTAAPIEGHIVVTVTDDGQGIDPDRIRQAAVRRGLFTGTEREISQLTDEEIIDLIFRPNLSTVTQVTEMSGRGVGLDVVRTNIERLSGSVVVTSEIGHGTSFQLTLPLTLALVRTMLVTVQNTLYALPVASISGAMYLASANLNTVKGKPVLVWQGTETVPLLDLREIFAHPSLTSGSPNGVKASVVLVTWGRVRTGLVVDQIMGQQEIVVKSLSPMLGRVAGLSGATILGDGRIALIIDIPDLINTTNLNSG